MMMAMMMMRLRTITMMATIMRLMMMIKTTTKTKTITLAWKLARTPARKFVKTSARKPARNSAKELARRFEVKSAMKTARKLARRLARKPARKPAKKLARKHVRKFARKLARPPMTLRCSRCNTHRIFRALIERGDVTKCLVVVFKTHDTVLKHSMFTSSWACISRSLGPPAFKPLQATMAASSGSSDDQGGEWRTMERALRTSLGMLKQIDHPYFKFYEFDFRANCSEFAETYWSTMRDCSDNEVIEYMKDIAEELEMDDITWRGLMIMFHDGAPGRAGAKCLLWKHFIKATTIEHVNIFKGTTYIFKGTTSPIVILKDQKNIWNCDPWSERVPPRPRDTIVQRSDGIGFKTAWEVLKEYHELTGPQWSGVLDEYISWQEDRIRDLHLAFETDWSTQQIPEDRSRASAPTQTSSSSSLAGQRSSYSVVGQDDPRP